MVALPETAEQAIRAYWRAAEANEQTPSRRGNVIVLTPEHAQEVMITADLHGDRLNFERACALADLANQPARHLIMQEVCHGGPPSPSGNGCMSHTLLEEVAALKVRYPERFHFLLSNHELAELMDFPIAKANRILNVLFRCGLMERYGEATSHVRDAYAAFLRSCPLAVHLANGVVVCHSAPEQVDRNSFDVSVFHRSLEPVDFQAGGAVFRLVWGRDYRQDNAAAFARLIGAELLIHGHEPCPEGYRVANKTQLILDSCGENGTYLVLPVAKKISQRKMIRRIRFLRSSATPP